MYAQSEKQNLKQSKAIAHVVQSSPKTQSAFGYPVAQLKKTISIINKGIDGESSDSGTATRMDKKFGKLNFKTVYSSVTSSEPGFPKFSCAEPSALSKLVEQSNTGNIYSNLENAEFGLTNDDNLSPLPTKYLNPKSGEKHRDFNPTPGRIPERFRYNSSENAAYLDPCGTCCLWMHPKSKDTFRIINSLKDNFK